MITATRVASLRDTTDKCEDARTSKIFNPLVHDFLFRHQKNPIVALWHTNHEKNVKKNFYHTLGALDPLEDSHAFRHDHALRSYTGIAFRHCHVI